MDTIIILDSTLLRAKGIPRTLKKFIDVHKEKADIYIPEVVLDEQTRYYLRVLETEIHASLRNYPFFYEILNIDYEESDFSRRLSEIDKKNLAKHLRNDLIDIFDGNIIALKSIELRDVYRRAMLREAPFMNNANKKPKNQHKKTTDSGFKDTLIWLTILNYNYENYSEVVFVTNDDDFQDNQKVLIKEFKKLHGKPLEMLRDFPNINKDKDEKNLQTHPKVEKKSTDTNDEKLEEKAEILLETYREIDFYRTELNQILENILMKNDESDWLAWNQLRFDINEPININEYDSFKNHLNNLVKQNIMSSEISPQEFLKSFLAKENIREYYGIRVQSVVNLLELIIKFEKALPEYTNSLLTAINSEINERAYIFDNEKFTTDYSNNIAISDDDLPF